nr:hypothetical protein [Tanacetum cinerariifolium]
GIFLGAMEVPYTYSSSMYECKKDIILVRNVDSSSKFYMYPRFLQLMIRAQVGDLSFHTTKYSSPTLTQKVFANTRTVEKGFSRVETPLFKVASSVPTADVDDVPAADAEPTPPPPPQELPFTSQVNDVVRLQALVDRKKVIITEDTIREAL